MTLAPPKVLPTSRPPPAPGVDSGRLITALAAGGSVLVLSFTAVILWPRTYGSEASLVLDEAARVDNPVALAGRIEAALLEREQLTSIAMELPPEARSPDPIGRLRAGIRVQARGAGYSVEFRGSEPKSVQRIANRLADRAVTLMPRLAAPPEDALPLQELATRSRAVSEFLSAHPEVTLEPADSKPANPANDSALELLRVERRQIEERLSIGAGAVDNPYAEPADDPVQLNRRLTELKTTIARREAALKQPRPPAASQELTARWRTLLTELAAAQAKAAVPAARSPVTARVTSRAQLPGSPLTPNVLVLSLVALLLSGAAAMIAYVLPRQPKSAGRATAQRPRSGPPPAGRSDPPPGRSDPPPGRSDPPPAGRSNPPPAGRSDPPPAGPPAGSDPPPRSSSVAPGPVAPQRTVVLSAPAPEAPRDQKRSNTAPGGLAAPRPVSEALAATVATAPPPRNSPPATPLFGSRPPPGAGSYSVSSSHPPPFEPGGGTRTTVERLSPLQSSHPPVPAPSPLPPPPASPASPEQAASPQIMSKPPALDPEAERWAAHFETPPSTEDAATRKRSGRWKTQVMGSMVPLEVTAAREGRPAPQQAATSGTTALAVAAPVASSLLVHHDVPSGWRPDVDSNDPEVVKLRDAVLANGLSPRSTLVVTGSSGNGKARLAGALSLALAQQGIQVLLVEADFDHPQLHEALAITVPSGAGFSQQIAARRRDKRGKPWVVLRCSPNLQLLAEGRLRSPGLLESEEFQHALRELSALHQLTIIHAPAVDHPGDLRSLDAIAQAAVVAAGPREATSSIRFGKHPLRGVV